MNARIAQLNAVSVGTLLRGEVAALTESTNSICWMGTLHLVFWGIATAFGLRFLGAGFAATRARSRSGLYVWSVIFVLVALQMTTALRPILEQAETFLPVEKKFFLKHWVECAELPRIAPDSDAAERDSRSSD